MTQLTLHYFPIAGRAGAIRDALRIGRIPFEDKHVGREEFRRLKAERELPFGSLPVLDVGQQLDEGGVRQLELPLRRPARQRADATCRRVRGDRLDEGRLADAGLPLQQQRARTVAKVVQEPRGGVHLGLSLEDHLGGSGEFGESAEPSAAGNMRFATYRARHPSTHAIVGFAS